MNVAATLLRIWWFLVLAAGITGTWLVLILWATPKDRRPW